MSFAWVDEHAWCMHVRSAVCDRTPRWDASSIHMLAAQSSVVVCVQHEKLQAIQESNRREQESYVARQQQLQADIEQVCCSECCRPAISGWNSKLLVEL